MSFNVTYLLLLFLATSFPLSLHCNNQQELGVQLRAAAYGGDLASLRELIEQQGADVDDASYQFKQTPLQLAASQGNFEEVVYLVFRGASLDLCDFSGKSALDYARQSNDANVIAFLSSCLKIEKKCGRVGVGLLVAFIYNRLYCRSPEFEQYLLRL